MLRHATVGQHERGLVPDAARIANLQAWALLMEQAEDLSGRSMQTWSV
jgi:hypothetical protein